MISVGALTLIVKGFAFYKETLIASMFGLSELLDTYFIAILIPSFVQNVFVGALKNLFIPNYLAELKNSGKKGEFQSISFLIITAMVLVLAIGLIIFTEFFLTDLYPDHDAKYYKSIRLQFYIILPSLIFWGYSSLLSGLLEINNKFSVSSFSPILSTLVMIVCLLFFQDIFGDMVLAVGILLGSLISFLYLLFYSIRQNEVILCKPRVNANIRMMIKQLPPKITSGFLTGINPFVDQFFAAQLAIGSISAINYGIKIPQFVVGILILALGNVLLPYFSRLIVEDLDKAYVHLFRILKINFGFTVIITLVTVLFSTEIISLLFERNEFTPEDTVLVSDIQRIVLLYVPFYLTTLVLVKFLTSINKNSFMAWTSLWNLVLNLILNIILIDKFGIYGLVLSTTIVYVISSLFYLGFTIKQYKKHRVSRI